MIRLLAFVVWSFLCGAVTTGCERQAAGSGSIGAILGGIVVWLWHRCHQSQCQSAVDGSQGLVHMDLELGENVGSEDLVGDSGTPM